MKDEELKDMIGAGVSVGDMIVLPDSSQGYSQHLCMIKAFKISKKGTISSVETVRFRNYSEGDFSGLSWYGSRVRPSTIRKYAVKINDMLSEEQLNLLNVHKI